MAQEPNLKINVNADTSQFSRGMRQAQGALQEFSKVAKTAFSPLGTAIAGVTAAVAGVTAAIAKLSEQNQALGDEWGRLTSGMAASWDTFKTAVANTNFTGILNDMREAARLARDLYDATDALGEINTAYNISLARQSKTINELQVKLRDASATDEERLEAGQKLLEIYSELEKNPTRGLLNVSEASLDKMAGKLGYQLKGATEDALKATRREVEDFFVWLGSEAGEAWSAAYAEAASDPAKLLQTTIEAQNAGLSDNLRGLLYNYQNNVGDKDRIAMEEAVTAYYNQQAKLSGETMRIQTQINSIKAGQAKDDERNAAAYQKSLKAQEQANKEALRAAAQAAGEVAAADEDMAKAANDSYEAWRRLNNMETQPFDNTELQMYAESLREVVKYEAQMVDETELLQGALDRMQDKINGVVDKSFELTQVFGEELVKAIESGLVGAFDALADAIGGVTDGGFENVIKALLNPLADMAIRVGTLIMLSGEAIEALKASLTTLFGGSAIIAGAALVAVGVAAKAGLAAIGSGNNFASSSPYVASGSYGSAGADYETRELQVNVTGTLRADGDQLEAVLNNTNKKKGYTT